MRYHSRESKMSDTNFLVVLSHVALVSFNPIGKRDLLPDSIGDTAMARPFAWEETMTPKERRDLRVLRSLAAGKSPTQAAAKVGISERTLYRRKLNKRAKPDTAERDAKKSQAKAG